MLKSNELKIDGYSIYIDQLKQLDGNINTHDAGGSGKKALDWASNEFERALKPAINICNSLRNAANEIEPNEIEFSMQFEICLKGETPVLKIVSAESTAQIAIKFVWKKEEQ